MTSSLAGAVKILEDLEWFERKVLGKANGSSILDDDGFVRAVLREARLLTAAVGASIASSQVRQQLLASTNIDWVGATQAQRDRAITELANMVQGLPSEFLPGVTTVLDEQGKIVAVDTHRALGKKYTKLPVNPTFLAENAQAIEAISKTSSIFFKPEYEAQAVRFRRRAQDTVAGGLEQGFGRRQIARDLRGEFVGAAVHEGYWDTVAAVHVNRARSFSSAVSYADGGVTSFEVLAVMDDRTTEICQMMDGTVLSVESALDSFYAFEDATDLDEVKTSAAPFMRRVGGEIRLPNGTRVASVGPRGGFSNVLSSTKMNQGGINMPPYHYRCRTTVIPVFEEGK